MSSLHEDLGVRCQFPQESVDLHTLAEPSIYEFRLVSIQLAMVSEEPYNMHTLHLTHHDVSTCLYSLRKDPGENHDMVYDLFRPPAMWYTAAKLFYTPLQLLVVLEGVVLRVMVVVGRNVNSKHSRCQHSLNH